MTEPSKRLLAFCRWYSNRLKYGFLRIISDDPVYKGKDVFVHVSNLRLAYIPDAFPTLHMGEYVECDVEEADRGLQATMVSGPWNNALMTEHVYNHSRHSSKDPPPPSTE